MPAIMWKQKIVSLYWSAHQTDRLLSSTGRNGIAVFRSVLPSYESSPDSRDNDPEGGNQVWSNEHKTDTRFFEYSIIILKSWENKSGFLMINYHVISRNQQFLLSR